MLRLHDASLDSPTCNASRSVSTDSRNVLEEDLSVQSYARLLPDWLLPLSSGLFPTTPTNFRQHTQGFLPLEACYQGLCRRCTFPPRFAKSNAFWLADCVAIALKPIHEAPPLQRGLSDPQKRWRRRSATMSNIQDYRRRPSAVSTCCQEAIRQSVQTGHQPYSLLAPAAPKRNPAAVISSSRTNEFYRRWRTQLGKTKLPHLSRHRTTLKLVDEARGRHMFTTYPFDTHNLSDCIYKSKSSKVANSTFFAEHLCLKMHAGNWSIELKSIVEDGMRTC